MTFAAATAVTRVADGQYRGEIAPGWDIVGNANGGYLIAIAARAMIDASGREDPVSLTAHYLRPGRPGPVTIATEVVKSGRLFAVVRATLATDAGPMLSLLGTFGVAPGAADLDSGVELVTAVMPDIPAVDDCVAVVGTDTFPPPFMNQVELRLHPDDAQFMGGQKSGEARMRGWFRLRDGEPMDTVALLQATDAFPPTSFNADLPVAWTPTVELTAHVRARPMPGWWRCSFVSRFVTGGFLEADGEVWDDSGRLVAQSRQLALVPRPE